jgi:pimeloyl-ACP methyl ester carboxylesterase
MCLLFAATYPERTHALVLHGGMARSTEAPEYPWAPPAAAAVEAAVELIEPYFFAGEDIELWVPSLGDDPQAREWLGRFRRAAVSPDTLAGLFAMFLDIDESQAAVVLLP